MSMCGGVRSRLLVQADSTFKLLCCLAFAVPWQKIGIYGVIGRKVDTST